MYIAANVITVTPEDDVILYSVYADYSYRLVFDLLASHTP